MISHEPSAFPWYKSLLVWEIHLLHVKMIPLGGQPCAKFLTFGPQGAS